MFGKLCELYCNHSHLDLCSTWQLPTALGEYEYALGQPEQAHNLLQPSTVAELSTRNIFQPEFNARNKVQPPRLGDFNAHPMVQHEPVRVDRWRRAENLQTLRTRDLKEVRNDEWPLRRTVDLNTLFPLGRFWRFQVNFTELGTSLFEIALSLFALERTFILRAMALLEAKSGAL